MSAEEIKSAESLSGTFPETGSEQLRAFESRVKKLEERLLALHPEDDSSADKRGSNEDVKTRFVTMKAEDGGNYTKSEGQQPWEEMKDSTESNVKDTVDLEFTTYMSKERVRQKTEIKIMSKGLLQRLKDVINDYVVHDENKNFWDQQPFVITSNNPYFFYRWEDLSKSAELAPDPVKKQLQYLLKFIAYTEPDFKRAQEAFKNPGETDKISEEHLWLLFPPNTIVVAKVFQKEPQLFIVDNIWWDDSGYAVNCWTYDWDGYDLVGKMYTIKIDSFKKPRKIIELPVYPWNVHKESGKLSEKLKDRGKKFREFCVSPNNKNKLLRCGGQIRRSLDFSSEYIISDTPEKKEYIEARETVNLRKEGFKVIVEPPLFERYAPGVYRMGSEIPVAGEPCDCELCDDRWRIECQKSFKNYSAGLDEKFYKFLPPRVLGYSLDPKAWAQIPVDHLSSLGQQDIRKWDELSLDDDHKKTIMNMVRAHLGHLSPGEVRPDQLTRIKDPVEGKGDGLVILLHGIPGVGKTLTAETLAMSLNCPLIRIDASDLDYESPTQVSNVLKRYFDMAASWGSILLLDEADVFLQARVRSEIKQNALVSVLLTSLEYFSGVLFMTTNRVKSIDTAVQSRIHYAVRFGRLDTDAIESIWKYYEDQLVLPAKFHKNTERADGDLESSEATRRAHEIQEKTKRDKKEIHDWFEENKRDLTANGFNGRDVRNLFVSAQLLAWAKEDKRLTKVEIKQVYYSTTEFRRDLQKIRDQTEAQQSVLRYD